MEKKALHFKEIKIDKTPGLANGLKPYSNLSPHINIIGGPNASGKTTTAKTIQKLLNQNDTAEFLADANFKLGAELWQSSILMGHNKMQREGIDSKLEGVPPPEEMSRYLLADIILAEKTDKNLADNIIKEAIGGYDLEKARGSLSYNDKSGSKNATQYIEFEKQSKAVDEEQSRQSKISGEEKQLASLESKEKEQKEASYYLELYKNLKNYKLKSGELEEIKNKISALPEVIAKVRENDAESFKTALEKIANSELKKKTEASKLDDIEEQIKELNLPKEGISGDTFTVLRDEVQDLRELNSAIERLKTEKRELEIQKNTLATNIGVKDVDLETFEGLNLDDIQQTDEIWQVGFSVYGEISLLEKEMAQLDEELSVFGKISNEQELIKGIDALADWLDEGQENSSNTGIPLAVAVAVLIIASAYMIGMTKFAIFGYGTALLAVILVIISVVLSKKSNSSGNKKYSRNAYKKTGLDEPKNWVKNEVVNKLNELIKELESARQIQSIQQKLAVKKELLQPKTERFENFKTQVEQIVEKIKSTPFKADISPENYQTIYWFTTNLIKWEDAYRNYKIKAAELEDNANRLNNLLDRLNSGFQAFTGEKAEDVGGAVSIFRQLEGRKNKYDEYIAKKKDIVNEMSQLDTFIVGQKEIVDEIAGRLHIKAEDIALVENYVTQIDDFRRLESELNNGKGALSHIQKEIEQSAVYENQLDTLNELDLKDLDVRIAEYDLETQKHAATLEEISRIRAEIKRVQETHDLEMAQAGKETAKEDFIQYYEEKLSANIGNIIIDELKAQINTERMPDVFNRAKELFAAFTHHRYELRINDRTENVQFSAKDTEDGLVRQLEELSTGTRVQLILAVRLAFIESTESTLKLPLLADELLARSDTQRAEAIIEAMIEISRGGRQIFYFTAQEDEMAKWKIILAKPQNSDIESREYILRPFEEYKWDNETKLTLIRFNTDIPNPDGLSHSEYGKALKLPAIAMDTATGANLHLWYFIDDTKLLYRLLEKGVKNYDSLRLHLNNGNQVEGLTDEIKSDLSKYVKLADAYFKLQRVGRSKPIDRKVLEDSGAVSNAFIERVTEKMAETDNDPECLLEALENGEVSRFTGGKITELREYLINNGYLSEEELLTQEELQREIEKSIVRLDINPKKAHLFFDRLLG